MLFFSLVSQFMIEVETVRSLFDVCWPLVLTILLGQIPELELR